MCIFCTASQLATAKHVLPEQFERVRQYEERWGKTIHRTLSVDGRVAKGSVTEAVSDESLVALARSEHYDRPIVLPEGEWRLMPGRLGSPLGRPDAECGACAYHDSVTL